MGDHFQRLVDSIIELDEDLVFQVIDELLAAHTDTLQIAEVTRKAIIKIGEMFEKKEIFLTELIMSGELLKEVMKKIGLSGENAALQTSKFKGKIVMGTVQGDIHDIGKNIVLGILVSNGYSVIDLGVDVPLKKFIESIKKEQPVVVALSGLLTAAYQSMKSIIDGFKKEGIRNSFKIMIGGGAVDQKVCEYVGADAFGQNAIDGLKIVQEWIKY